LVVALILTVVHSVRGRERPPATPTIDLGAVRTEAVGTFASNLTSTAQALPTSTATNTPPAVTPTAATGTGALSPTPSCYRMQFVRDVTIPDNTPMTPAQVFTKTWQVQNSGTCPWRVGFKLVLIGGDAMGGSPFIVQSTVNPGARIEASIKMVAPPNQTGIVQGTWRMSDDIGTLFGDALTVVIVVGNGTAPASATAPASGVTPTP
jgi:Ig-like domain-containing protein